MFEHVLVPLLLTENLGEVNGKTRFQKLVFLVQRSAEKKGIEGIKLNFDIYLHGPFSQELSLIIDDLVRDGYLNEFIEQTPPKYEMHIYGLTNKGKGLLKFAKSKKLVSTKMVSIISDVVKQFGDLPLPQLVDEAYKRF